MRLVAAFVFCGAVLMSATVAGAQEIDWQKVDNAFGRKPAVVSGDVHRYGFPRTDLNVTLDGVTLALGGWVAFKPIQAQAMAMMTTSEAMAMGDLVGERDQSCHGDAGRAAAPVLHALLGKR